jgi:preprotein translocase subunit SecF
VEAGFSNTIDTKELETYKISFRDSLESKYNASGDIELTKYTNIGASFGEYIKNTARLTLFLAIVAIAIYIAYAFSGSA